MNGVTPRLQPNWDWRAAGNFTFGGTGTGFLVFASIAALGGFPVRLPGLIGMAFVALGLTMVWLEIGKPWRFLNVYFHPQRSWMTREAYAALPLFAVGGLAVLLDQPGLLLTAAALGLIFLYCQARILRAAKGVPAWRAPLLLPLILTTGLTEGACLLLIALSLLGQMPAWPVIAAALLVVLRGFLWRDYLNRLRMGAPSETLAVLSSFGKIFLILGHAVPLIAFILGATTPGASLYMAPAGAIFALLAGWAMKYTIVTKAAHKQGFAILHHPSRGPKGTGGPGVKPGWN